MAPFPFPIRDILLRILIPTYFQNQHCCGLNCFTDTTKVRQWVRKMRNGWMGRILYSRTLTELSEEDIRSTQKVKTIHLERKLLNSWSWISRSAPPSKMASLIKRERNPLARVICTVGNWTQLENSLPHCRWALPEESFWGLSAGELRTHQEGEWN